MIKIEEGETKETIKKYIDLFHNRPRKSTSGLGAIFKSKFSQEILEMEIVGKSKVDGLILVIYSVSSISGQDGNVIKIWIGKSTITQNIFLVGIKRNNKTIRGFISSISYIEFIQAYFKLNQFIEHYYEEISGIVGNNC